ncbi:MAG: GrpB family protein [Aestuariibacter sp.]|nr:GrpB family protein [Aestuariibacter sp.]
MRFITAYQESWPTKFKAIVEHLTQYVPVTCKFHHIGSTAVPGMSAKDIIDMDIECSLGSMPQIVRMLADAGYAHEGNKGIATREAFCPIMRTKAAELPAHHLYACECDSPELRKHIAYRDYLILHPERAEWLANEKRIADSIAGSKVEYINNKSAAYQIVMAESLQWADANSPSDRPAPPVGGD